MNPKSPRGRWLTGWRWLALAVAAQPWALSAQPAPTGARVLSSGGDGAGASVALGGSMGEQVVLIIDGRTRVVRVGEPVDGMVVRRAPGGALLLETGPGQAPQRLGSTPVRVGSFLRGTPVPERLVLQAGGDRLYRGEGEINGRAISGVVDTGASVMVVPAAQARRLGLPEHGGREVDVQTAAGRSVGRRVKIERVRLGPLEARDVDAVVIDVDLPYVLYGNSFLQDFHLQWGQGRLTLSVAPPP
jgi:aspartyl protease family protein